MSNKIYIQVSSGRGPAECCRVVAKVVELMLKEAKQATLKAEVVDREEGELNRTLQSAVLTVEGEQAAKFLQLWEGTVQWISRSPYRKFHKRKNWFVGVNRITVSSSIQFDESRLLFQTMRSSGPGGQHVNKTESAVRVTHPETGISVTASDQRSQHQNKQLAIERLKVKLAAVEAENTLSEIQASWNNHNSLKRGNPIRIIEEQLD